MTVNLYFCLINTTSQLIDKLIAMFWKILSMVAATITLMNNKQMPAQLTRIVQNSKLVA